MLKKEPIISARTRMSIEHLPIADGEEEHSQLFSDNDLFEQFFDESD